MGARHYAQFGLEPPATTKFVIPRDEPTGKLDRPMALMIGIASYYRPVRTP